MTPVLGAALIFITSAFAEDVTIKLSVLPGLKYDQPRFAVKPGAKVTVVFHNPDQMIHNFVVTAPGARNDVVNAALEMGADGIAKNFVPDSPKILWHTKALAPGETTTLTFTAPGEEAVYPYVCTFPGHGFIMYGAMYVTTKPLPPLESDPNVAPAAPVIADASDHSHHTLDRPVVSRTFLPDCGPAAIAIGLPGGQSYCFDAGTCRLRYAWRGGFVDNNDHWAGKGETMGKVVGRIYYRAPNYFPIRIGDVNREPQVRWRGYDIVKGTPQLRYTLDGVEVRESASATQDGIEFSYDIAANAPVFFKTEPDVGAKFTSSAGAWTNGVLTLTPAQAKHFTLTLAERPGVEPLAYWSMNDLVFNAVKDPPPGVVGRAFTPGGTSGKPKMLDTGLSTAVLKNGGTLMAWVKLDPTDPIPKKKSAPPTTPAFFSAGAGHDALVLVAPTNDEQWHHVAVTFHGGVGTRYLDGQNSGDAGVKLPATDANLVIGSIGEKAYFNGLIDEVRIYDRTLTDAEIQRIYQREKPTGTAAQSTSSQP
jgi:azurin